ncbi:MAG: C39 family peptidase [Clostridia bacterium]|nr:C39 family peptidase [Clostridia bacterium]
MKRRKIVSVLLASVFISSSTVLLWSNTGVNVEFENATEITRKIFNANAGTEDERKGYMTAEYLQGLDGEQDYILVECDTGGYAIFDRESMEIIEYSDTDSSPYIQAETPCYGGPISYYDKKGDELKDIKTGKKLQKQTAKEIAKEIKTKIKEDRKKRKEKQKEKTAQTAEDEIQNDLSADPGPTGTLEKPADYYQVYTRKYISKYQFFEENDDHGDNVDGTCVSVAVQLLLAYNNWVNDGRIIPANPKDGEEFLRPDREDYKDQPNSSEWKATTSEDDKDDNKTTFYERIKSYINPYARTPDEVAEGKEEDPQNNGATMRDAYNGIRTYLQEYAQNAYVDNSMDYYIALSDSERENVVQKLQSEINNDRPVIASIDHYEQQNDGTYKKEGHAIVVHGYQTISYNGSALDGFIAHYGHGKSSWNYWVNSDWFKGYLTFQTTHQHTDEVFFTDNADIYGHVLECSTCHRAMLTEEHNWKDATYMQMLPNYQDYERKHYKACYCGYKVVEDHDLKCYVAPWDEYKHVFQCVCGYNYNEYHYYKYGINCFYCGQTKNY